MGNILAQAEPELLGERYIVYITQVATRVGTDGKPTATANKAFEKRIE